MGNKADIRTGNKKRRRQDALYGLINYTDDNAFLKHLSAPLGLKTQDVFSGLSAVLRISPVIVLYYIVLYCATATLSGIWPKKGGLDLETWLRITNLQKRLPPRDNSRRRRVSRKITSVLQISACSLTLKGS